MIIVNTQTGRRFYYGGNWDSLVCSVGAEDEENARVYENGRGGLSYAGTLQENREKGCSPVGLVITAIEVDKNGDIVVCNAEDPASFTFRYLRVMMATEKVHMVERMMSRDDEHRILFENITLGEEGDTEEERAESRTRIQRFAAKYGMQDCCKKREGNRDVWELQTKKIFRKLKTAY